MALLFFLVIPHNLCFPICMEVLMSLISTTVSNTLQDAFREAKANGFYVTVIRKGLVKLNVDQTLEEVEEEITEIGSKMYHDKIMRERSIDANTLMKGVVTADRSTKRYSHCQFMLTIVLFSVKTSTAPKRSRQRLMKPTKPAKS
ncbi:hypothetical protein BHE74_00004720 [Ensete ventricosum]|nr:hypothetical protein GW17_00042614 [Ensete ventricosum]RWW86500.1 hypothetical protein BHE74_00004720 [Ensete ventricosum]